MNKIGRNRLCPCGSGKKYKKCCLGKEDQAKLEQRARQAEEARKREMWELQNRKELAECFEDDPDFEDGEDFEEDSDFRDNGEIGERFLEEEELESLPEASRRKDHEALYGSDEGPPLEAASAKPFDAPLPEIGTAESDLVEQWWKAFLEMEDVDQMREHLEMFMERHPDLVLHLELHDEALFEIKSKYVEQQRHGEYAALLQRVRKEFPDTYIKSFGFYERDLLAYQVMTGNREAVGEYLKYFHKYPEKDPENLFKVIHFLMAHDCEAQVADLVNDIYTQVFYSRQIFGGAEIMVPVVISRLAPYLRIDFTEESLAELAARMQTLDEVVPSDNAFTPKRLTELFGKIFKTRRRWNIADCATRRDLEARYYDVSLDFMRFLHENEAMGWIAAEFYRGLVMIYLCKVIPEGKRPKDAFVFTRLRIEQTVVKTTRDILWLDSTRALGMLRGLHAFARYLQLTETITEARSIEIQGWCREIYEECHQMMVKSNFTAKAFEKEIR